MYIQFLGQWLLWLKGNGTTQQRTTVIDATLDFCNEKPESIKNAIPLLEGQVRT